MLASVMATPIAKSILRPEIKPRIRHTRSFVDACSMCFGSLFGLKSDISRGPGCAMNRHFRLMVRFLRRHGCSQGQALTLGGVAETFVALNRGPRVEPMDIWSGYRPSR